ncbi:acetate/propionate family kinase [Lactobacillus kefiranofaciens]|uniref:Acetate kinase n=1 Tax=Lactobacillus kefiranofaciens TaxID=267818 RepID=A0AAX3UG71_9LACO|nr:acetate kinase [Lactobacillus kefiranofaciens]AEG39982.1 Acetate kinase [Lactobacillus kefiranofaciens subsp. kefiranofaciens]KRL29054.1 acetate kinase [Lactobacillus kefiranofaciens subsp. kefirgranum DSM 10550 = JCM 8572]KRM19377.1 acetate kinase [Lactobacillus kefiranofaciens subsp. kefiranofaciens DSM 5016 = JCM 6985]MCJ2173113.1 acetate kinase [Lactobacillus kefiranofaciens]PAK96380.1 acetate kinase [Lactobacillus kefiranofaciens]
MKKILVINSGSSSFKFKLFSFPEEKVLAEGMADRVGLDDSSFETKLADKSKHVDNIDIPDQATAVKLLLTNLKKYDVINDPHEIIGIGHRIVAGGEKFKNSSLITKDNLHEIYDLQEYAPLHNVAEADDIKAFIDRLPDVPEVAVFDTSFHQSLDPVHYLYSVPYEYYRKYKVRKYGAHGTSVRFVTQKAAQMLNKPLTDLRLIVCHLGSGASITAVKDGKSLDTSMGFTPVAGITMSTRSGDVDPSLLEYVMHKENLIMDEMISILNHKSGLLGISEISPDMRDLREDMTPLTGEKKRKADLARNIFINRICRYIGSYIVEMSGVDGIIFTAGVGEHDYGVRERVMNALKFLGMKPDLEANRANKEGLISQPDSKIATLLIPTNEELMIERDVVRVAKLK